ncbi:MAG TPA: hypothetical protein PLC80_19150 [Draconibacterium sp.]|nr:hypothetical protein [Draconibacterium sp.]
MGYMGFGMQPWISNMKPKPFFGRRNRPGTEHADDFAGHDIQDLFHLNQNNLDNLNQKKPTKIYLRNLRKQLLAENRRTRVYGWIIFVFTISVLVAGFIYLSRRFDLF